MWSASSNGAITIYGIDTFEIQSSINDFEDKIQDMKIIDNSVWVGGLDRYIRIYDSEVIIILPLIISQVL